jgi:protein-disulfide isomerase
MDSAEVSRRLAETRDLAQTLAVSGTPTFVFGDQMLRGYLPFEEMQTMLAELRAAQ